MRCFFIGHGDAPETVVPRLLQAVETHIVTYGVQEFVVGHYGNFDRLAAQAVRQLKKQHPQVRLTLLLPYHPTAYPDEPSAEFDGSWYPFDTAVPPRVAVVKSNQKAIDSCEFLIAYVRHTGNARGFLDYARKRQVQVWQL